MCGVALALIDCLCGVALALMLQSPVCFVYCITLSRRCAASAVRVPSTNPATTIPARTTGAVIPLVVVKVMVSGVDGLILRYVGNI